MRHRLASFASVCLVALCAVTGANGQTPVSPLDFATSVAARPADADLPPASRPVDSDSTIFWRHETAAKASPPFHRKTFEFTIGGEGYTALGRHDSADTLAFLTVGLGYYVANNLSVNVEFDLAPGTWKDGSSDDSTDGESDDDCCNGSFRLRAYGGQFLLRDHFYDRERFSLYAEAGAGVLHTRGGFPTGNRSDSLVLSAGIGAIYRVSEQAWFSAGVRYAHLSGVEIVSTRDHGAFEGVQYYGMFSVAW